MGGRDDGRGGRRPPRRPGDRSERDGRRDSFGARLPWETEAPWERTGSASRTPRRPSSGRGGTAKKAAAQKASAQKASTQKASAQRASKQGAPKKRAPARRSALGAGRKRGSGRGRRPAARVLRSRRRLARLGSPLRRINAGLLVVVFILTLFTGRLVQLQALDSEEYSLQAQTQRIRTQILYADRGDITDRYGVPFALSVDAEDLYVDPTKVPATPGRLADGSAVPSKEQAAQRLSPILGVPVADLREKLTSKKRFVYLAKQVTPEQVRAARDVGIPTLGADPNPKRTYPSDTLGASVIGYVGSSGKGLGGVELARDEVLAGRNGKQVVEIGRNGQVIPAAAERLRDVVPGQDVTLTLDSEIQWAAQRAIEAQVEKTKAHSGSVIVMDPATGAVLALATAPGFDPAERRPTGATGLGNPAVQDVYEPGSTNKVITAAAALEHTTMEPTTEMAVPGALRRYDKTFHDDVPHGTWNLTLAGILAKSSNIGIDLVSEKVGEEQLYRSLRDFGFGERTGVGLPGESRGLMPAPDTWSGTQRYTIPFGQGISVNAMQMASVYATIANDGVRVQPNVYAGSTAPDGTVTKPDAPERKRVISSKTAKQMRLMLEGVTGQHGTAQKAQISGFRVAGKTGTAQRVNPDCGCYRGYTASFVGMAPADDPKLVAQVVLQDPKKGHFGGQVAAPVFHDVMSFSLQHEKVRPTGTKSPKIRVWADE